VNYTNSTVIHLIEERDFFGLFTQAFVNLLGVEIFVSIAGLLLMMITYIFTQSVAVPSILALFVAGSVAVFLPPRANYLMYVFLALAITGIVYRLYKGGTQY